jgi:hypothetical protein
MAWDRYVTPFSYGLWLAVAIAVCVIGVCLAVTNYGYERKKNPTFSATLFSIHACFCGQGEIFRSCNYISIRIIYYITHPTGNPNLNFLIPNYSVTNL